KHGRLFGISAISIGKCRTTLNDAMFADICTTATTTANAWTLEASRTFSAAIACMANSTKSKLRGSRSDVVATSEGFFVRISDDESEWGFMHLVAPIVG